MSSSAYQYKQNYQYTQNNISEQVISKARDVFHIYRIFLNDIRIIHVLFSLHLSYVICIQQFVVKFKQYQFQVDLVL